MVLEPAARAELSRSFLARSCSAIPSLPSLLNPPRLQAGRDAPPSIWEGGSRGTEGALPLVLLESKKPTLCGVGLVLLKLVGR